MRPLCAFGFFDKLQLLKFFFGIVHTHRPECSHIFCILVISINRKFIRTILVSFFTSLVFLLCQFILKSLKRSVLHQQFWHVDLDLFEHGYSLRFSNSSFQLSFRYRISLGSIRPMTNIKQVAYIGWHEHSYQGRTWPH